MFSRRSRYFKLNDTAFPDRYGIKRHCKAVRRIKNINGQFFHALDKNDRLDHLAYKYYRQSLYWWCICDANLEYKSPLELLDKMPIIRIQLTLSISDVSPPLADLYSVLKQLIGVEKINKGDNKGLPTVDFTESAALFTLPASASTDLDLAVLRQEIPATLNVALQAEGINLPSNNRISQPEEKLWQIAPDGSPRVYRFRSLNNLSGISVNQGIPNYTLLLLISYNQNSITQEQMLNQITALGFVVEELTVLNRIGQSIVIPPRYTGVG